MSSESMSDDVCCVSSLGSSWLQIERCMKAQWRGYDAYTRKKMDSEWKNPNGAPGIVGRVGCHRVTIWYVEREGSSLSTQDILMSVKEDFI